MTTAFIKMYQHIMSIWRTN